MFILPINRDNYHGPPPIVVFGLIAVNTAALICGYFLSQADTIYITVGFTPSEPHAWQMFSSMFIHAGWWHLLGNMFFLWMFGWRVENALGRWLFVAVYLLSGLGADAAHYLSNPRSTVPTVGASGAISGIVGCYFFLFPKSKFDIEIFFWRFNVKTIHTQTYGAVGAWVGEQAALGLISQAVTFSSTAFWAHIGGFVTGFLICRLLLQAFPAIREREAFRDAGPRRLKSRAAKSAESS